MGQEPGERIDAPPGRRVIFLVGPSGSGKSVIGKKTADLTGWRLFDTDSFILRETGCTNIAEIFDSLGELYFRTLEAECVNSIAKMGERLIVATGGGLPVIVGLMPRLNELGLTVYLKASVDTLWTRLCMDPDTLADRPLLREGGQEALCRMIDDREGVYTQAALALDTEQLSVDEVCALLRTQVESMELHDA